MRVRLKICHMWQKYFSKKSRPQISLNKESKFYVVLQDEPCGFTIYTLQDEPLLLTGSEMIL